MSKIIKAILFDMDGVIVNSEPMHRKAYHMMFEQIGVKPSPSHYASFTGQSTLEICRKLVTHFCLDKKAEDLVAIKRHYFNTLFDNDKSLELIPGVMDLIKDFHSNGLILILASSASMENIERIFTRFNLNIYFKAKISGANLKASKPDPEIFIKAAEAAGVKSSNCVVIEDSENGITAAKAAGIYTIAYNSPDAAAQDSSNADRVIQDFSEINFESLQKIKFSK